MPVTSCLTSFKSKATGIKCCKTPLVLTESFGSPEDPSDPWRNLSVLDPGAKRCFIYISSINVFRMNPLTFADMFFWKDFTSPYLGWRNLTSRLPRVAASLARLKTEIRRILSRSEHLRKRGSINYCLSCYGL